MKAILKSILQAIHTRGNTLIVTSNIAIPQSVPFFSWKYQKVPNLLPQLCNLRHALEYCNDLIFFHRSEPVDLDFDLSLHRIFWNMERYRECFDVCSISKLFGIFMGAFYHSIFFSVLEEGLCILLLIKLNNIAGKITLTLPKPYFLLHHQTRHVVDGFIVKFLLA